MPTFRGPDGLWRTHRPEALATPEAFQADPRLVWEWYGWRRERVGACRPNAAHAAIARLTLENEDARLVTQNVDGLHELALEEVVSEGNFPGDSAARAAPLRLHGSLFRTRCTATAGRRLVWRGTRSRDPATGDGRGGDRRSLPGRGHERAGTPGCLAAPPDERVRGRGCGSEPRVYCADGNFRFEHSRPSRADSSESTHDQTGTEWLTVVFTDHLPPFSNTPRTRPSSSKR